MSTVEIDIGTLLQGVSRQPGPSRLPNQAEEIDNCSLFLGQTLSSRPSSRPMYFSPISDYSVGYSVAENLLSNVFVFWFYRDSVRRYMVLVDKNRATASEVVTVWDLVALTKKTVNLTGVGSPGFDPIAYLKTAGNLTEASIADTMLIANAGVTVAVSGASTTHLFSGTAVTSTANAHNKASYLDFDQPPAASGEYWYARTDAPGYPAGFYISQNHATSGPKYARVRAEEAGYQLTRDTMPVSLTYNAGTDDFTLSVVTWEDRKSGDTVTNPAPLFVGRKITDIAFALDRLWIGFDDRVQSSALGNYKQFWLDNWRVIGLNDQVDIQTTGESVSNVKHIIGVGSSVLVFCTSKYVFQIRSATSEPLGPATQESFPCATISTGDCRPIHSSQSRILVPTLTAPTEVWEVVEIGDRQVDSGSISNHVHNYLPAGASKASSDPTLGVSFFSFGAENKNLYAYFSAWNSERKIQSAWCRWTFNDRILSHEVQNSILYIVRWRASKIYLERIDLTNKVPDIGFDGPMPYRLVLDGAVIANGIYTDGVTSWDAPNVNPHLNTVVFGASASTRKGRVLGGVTFEDTALTQALYEGDYGDVAVWIGESVPVRIVFSEQFVRNEGESIYGTTKLKKLLVRHENTGEYSVVTTPNKRQPYAHTFTSARTGSFNIGDLVLATGQFTAKTMANAQNTEVKLITSKPFPLGISNMKFIVDFERGRSSPTA